jgi:hypothetical protein
MRSFPALLAFLLFASFPVAYLRYERSVQPSTKRLPVAPFTSLDDFPSQIVNLSKGEPSALHA